MGERHKKLKKGFQMNLNCYSRNITFFALGFLMIFSTFATDLPPQPPGNPTGNWVVTTTVSSTSHEQPPGGGVFMTIGAASVKAHIGLAVGSGDNLHHANGNGHITRTGSFQWHKTCDDLPNPIPLSVNITGTVSATLTSTKQPGGSFIIAADTGRSHVTSSAALNGTADTGPKNALTVIVVADPPQTNTATESGNFNATANITANGDTITQFSKASGSVAIRGVGNSSGDADASTTAPY